jgi:site-specific DNA-methyltransferase (adenine-specific)
LGVENTRIPFAIDENKVGHNPHPLGRIPTNIVRTENQKDGYDKFFTVPKVRQNKDGFNTHPTIKPVELMSHLVKLISFEEQIILDPFMGSGSTAVASNLENRQFIGYEIDPEYFEMAKQRISQQEIVLI